MLQCYKLFPARPPDLSLAPTQNKESFHNGRQARLGVFLSEGVRGVPAISPPRKLRWVLDAGCWVGALDPAPRSALRSCQPGAARCRWRLDSSLIQHLATQPSSLSTQRIQPLGAWVEAGSSRRAPGWVMYMGTGSSLGEAGWQASGFGRNAS